MSGSRLRHLLCCVASLFTVTALAAEPLYVKNLSPVAGLLGLPSQRQAASEEPGALAAALHTGIANNYISMSRDSEVLHLDGETLRLALELRYGFAPLWDLQLELPWLDHSGGELDSAIDGWHDFWGMPDGGRDAVDRNQLQYRYLSAAQGFGLDESASGLGDISLALNRELWRSEQASISAQLGVKFGTGAQEKFLGSGGDDGYLALRASGENLAGVPLSWHTQLGYLRAGSSDVLGDRQQRTLWFAGASLDWAIAQPVSLLLQLDAHAAPMTSAISALGNDAFMLALGVRWRFVDQWSLDVSLIEDISVATTADITFQASLRYRP